MTQCVPGERAAKSRCGFLIGPCLLPALYPRVFYMIISHKYKYIFIRTNKTAGSSIEIALSRFCGAEDITTRDLPEEEALKKKQGVRTGRNYKIPFHRYSWHDWKETIGKTLRGEKRKTRRYYNHSSAAEIRRLAGETVWNNYYKFCFERNPWDRAISYYYFILEQRRIRGKETPSLSEFIAGRGLDPLKKHGINNYMLDGKIVVDRVCLYENLEAELEYVCNYKIGLPEIPPLSRAKGSFRKDRRHYRDILHKNDRDIIARMFSKEIELFGYEY